MEFWSVSLLVLVILIYGGVVLIYYLIRLFCKKIGGINIAISLSKLAILLAIVLLSFGGIFFVFNDMPNAVDFSVMGFYLLMIAILAMSFNYARTIYLENATIRKQSRIRTRLKDRVVPGTLSYESIAKTVNEKLTNDKIYTRALEKECAESLSRYLGTRDRKSLRQTLCLIGALEEREGRLFPAWNAIVKRYLIFLIITMAVALRLYHLDAPITGLSSWRQADTASIARNFYENDFRLLHPQIDWRGNSSGYVESEFPIYPFIVAGFYKLFGFTEQWGRLLSVVFWLISIYVLYLLVQKYLGPSEGLWSCLLLSFLPIPLYFSRTFMPESMLIMCSVLGIYFFSEWLTTDNYGHFLVSASFIALACLIKIPTLYLGLPIAYLAWVKYRGKTLSQLRLWLFALLILIPIGLWYHHAHQLFLDSGLTFGIWDYGTGKWGNWSLLLKVEFWKRIFLERLSQGYLTWAGLPLFLAGLVMKRKHRKEILFDFWLIAVFIYFLIVAKGNYVHEYYQLPFVVPASIYMGKALGRYISRDTFRKKQSFLLGICAIVVVVLSFSRYYSYLKYEDRNWELVFFTQEVKQKVEEKALVVAVDNGDPTLLYLTHRKGWHAWADQLQDSILNERRLEGARYVIGKMNSFSDGPKKQRLGELLNQYDVIIKTDNYFVLQISR